MALLYVKAKGASGKGEAFSPSAWDYGEQDVSDPSAGRTLDGIMHKKLVTRKKTINLTFNGTQKKESQRILKAFGSHEYMDVYYEDDKTGQWVWRTFYAGDRAAKRWAWFDGCERHETITVSLIEQ